MFGVSRAASYIGAAGIKLVLISISARLGSHDADRNECLDRSTVAVVCLLRSRFALTLGRLACGLSFLAALWLTLLLSLRGLLGLALLRRSALGGLRHLAA
jgi:hypothetical protein